MIDREKVIKGLEYCGQREFSCNGCPYYKDESPRTVEECLWRRIDEAIALLKEQDELLHKKQCDINKLCTEISEWKHKFHDTLKEQEAKEQCLKIKCVICPHCDNCDVDENGMLKEQEAVAPRRIDGKRNHFIKCGNCNYDLVTGFQFCLHCGKAVKWNGSD